MKTYHAILLLTVLALSGCGTFLDKLGETGANFHVNFLGAEVGVGFKGKDIVSAAVAPATYVLDATGISKQSPAQAPAPIPTPKAIPQPSTKP